MSDSGGRPAVAGQGVEETSRPADAQGCGLREDGIQDATGKPDLETASAESSSLEAGDDHTSQMEEAPVKLAEPSTDVSGGPADDLPSPAEVQVQQEGQEPAKQPTNEAAYTSTRSSVSSDTREDVDAMPLEQDLRASAVPGSTIIDLRAATHDETPEKDPTSDASHKRGSSSLGAPANAELDTREPHQDSETATPPAPDKTLASEPTIVFGVVLVGFNHALGPVVEYCYPSSLSEDDEIAKALPFLALPDGAHLRDEDYSCFHLYLPQISRSTVYGISCIRQLRADDLLHRTADVTRSTVQKGVVVLANKPIFGPIRDKLGVITRAFFAQRDFAQTEILEHFYKSLESAVKDEEQTDENAIHMGIFFKLDAKPII